MLLKRYSTCWDNNYIWRSWNNESTFQAWLIWDVVCMLALFLKRKTTTHNFLNISCQQSFMSSLPSKSPSYSSSVVRLKDIFYKMPTCSMHSHHQQYLVKEKYFYYIRIDSWIYICHLYFPGFSSFVGRLQLPWSFCLMAEPVSLCSSVSWHSWEICGPGDLRPKWHRPCGGNRTRCFACCWTSPRSCIIDFHSYFLTLMAK